jgi:hypothetical protein
MSDIRDFATTTAALLLGGPNIDLRSFVSGSHAAFLKVSGDQMVAASL